MSHPLVSVILPAYNHEAFVGEAVASVLGQTLGDLELIVIDDASADGTWEVLQAIRDPRLLASRHAENRGAHATLNEGLAAARGDYLAILNSDDLYATDRLEAGLACLREQQADLLGTDIVLMDDRGAAIVDHWWLDAFGGLKAVWHDSRDWAATLLEGNVFMTSSNFLCTRDYYQAVGGFADYRYVLDYDWLLRGLRAGRRLAWLDRPLLRYRWHEGNTIAEKPMAANVECAAMLRSHLPGLLGAGDEQRRRLEHLASQWARMDRYVGEIGATLRHEAVSRAEAALFELIDDRDRWIAERDSWLAERDAIIGQQQLWIAERDGWIADRDRWIAERDALVRQGEAALAECQRMNERLLASASYRIGRVATAPARWLRRLAGKGEA